MSYKFHVGTDHPIGDRLRSGGSLCEAQIDIKPSRHKHEGEDLEFARFKARELASRAAEPKGCFVMGSEIADMVLERGRRDDLGLVASDARLLRKWWTIRRARK